MLGFVAARVARGVVLVVAVVVITFFVTHVISDPARRILPLDAPQSEVDRLNAQLGLDRPLGEQFGDFASSAVRFDFGESFWDGRDTTEIVAERIPRTFELVAAGMVLAVVIGVPFGVALALSKRRWVVRIGNGLSILMLSVPQFWVGLILILVFAVRLGWLPTSGDRTVDSIILPAVTLALPAAGRAAQITRSTVQEQLGEAYVRTTVAKGLPRRRVLVHVLRGCSVPVVTMIGWEAVTALAGYTILVETVFSWPGLGLLATEAIGRQDLPLTEAVVFTVAVIVVVANTLVDITYRLLDPRVAIRAGASA
jgi:peptide/nickel transport system permease protein